VKLPDRIPKRLRNLALFLPEFDDGEGAWFKADAMAVIESLKGTTVPVSDVVILNMAPWGYAPSDLALSVDRFPNEADADYAGRSPSLALDFIRGSEMVDDKTLFALTFPLWKDAA
jgi:hypothetical protein